MVASTLQTLPNLVLCAVAQPWSDEISALPTMIEFDRASANLAMESHLKDSARFSVEALHQEYTGMTFWYCNIRLTPVVQHVYSTP